MEGGELSPTLLAEPETHFFGCLAKVLLRTCPGFSDFRKAASIVGRNRTWPCISSHENCHFGDMWHIAEVVVDPVLTDLHKLERKCLIEVTRHGVCVDESSACYVDAAVKECVADLCNQHAGCTSLQIQSSQP